MNYKSFTLRIDKAALEKVKYLANIEERTMNGFINYLIKQAIREHEKQHGKIE